MDEQILWGLFGVLLIPVRQMRITFSGNYGTTNGSVLVLSVVILLSSSTAISRIFRYSHWNWPVIWIQSDEILHSLTFQGILLLSGSVGTYL
jgi:hypothetical protein